MIRLRRSRRSLAIGSALMLAAAALVAVTLPVAADAEDGSILVYRDHFRTTSVQAVCHESRPTGSGLVLAA
ncbi:hypothetical protein [Nocardia jejuensis]|uniref:hypothetical protein n=1 Tax=Nocardia jejuensis TaxID=328049 RepID=UPI000831B2B0|nr:hypothetical protein [Nocardia jejuensis]